MIKLFSRWAKDSDEEDFVEVKRRISKLISYNKVDTLGCFQEEKIRPIRWSYNLLACFSTLTKKNFNIQVCRNESEAISNSTPNFFLYLILSYFLTIFFIVTWRWPSIPETSVSKVFLIIKQSSIKWILIYIVKVYYL